MKKNKNITKRKKSKASQSNTVKKKTIIQKNPTKKTGWEYLIKI